MYNYLILMGTGNADLWNISTKCFKIQLDSIGLLVNYTFIFSHSFASTGVVTGRIKNKD